MIVFIYTTGDYWKIKSKKFDIFFALGGRSLQQIFKHVCIYFRGHLISNIKFYLKFVEEIVLKMVLK